MILKICKEVKKILEESNKTNLIKNVTHGKITSHFSEIKKVPDVCRGQVNITNGKASYESMCNNNGEAGFCGNSRFHDKKPENIKNSIVLLLESPHVDEYDEDFNPIAPAQGMTGCAINLKISECLNDIFNMCPYAKVDDGEYPLIIGNPIQWQTSLHHILGLNLWEQTGKSIRNKVWRTIWEQVCVKNDFNDRLKSYGSVLIINACTSGLKDLVKKYLKEHYLKEHSKKQVICYHPCIWSSRGYGSKKVD